MLRFDKPTADRNGVELIGADAAIEDFPLAGVGIEGPLGPALDDRNREWPVVVTDEKKRAAPGLRVDGHLRLLFSLRGELGRAVSILRFFTGQHDGLELGPEHLLERIHVELRRCGDECVASLLWRIKRSDLLSRSDSSRSPCRRLRRGVESHHGCQAQANRCADEHCLHGPAPSKFAVPHHRLTLLKPPQVRFGRSARATPPQAASVSNTHLAPCLTIGTGNCHWSLPTRRNARLCVFGSTDTTVFSSAFVTNAATLAR